MKRGSFRLVFEDDDLNEEAVNAYIAQNKKIKEEETARSEIKEEEGDEKINCQEENPAKRRKTVIRGGGESPGDAAVTVERISVDRISDSVVAANGDASIQVNKGSFKKRVRKRCSEDGCLKQSQGLNGKCVAHGGGERCGVEGCPKSAQGKTGKCIAHGGGPRCVVDGCLRSAL